jgi:hypothetical protein
VGSKFPNKEKRDEHRRALEAPPSYVPSTYVTKDSGQREEFDTGSRRDTREGKGRYDLLPPLALRRLAGLYERGAAKYGDRNWERGQPLTRYMDSLLRHAFAVLEGKDDEDHVAAIAWNALGIAETQERIARGLMPADLDDLPNLQTPTAPNPAP